MRLAASRPFCPAGNSRPIKTAMIAITTSSSINVKPFRCPSDTLLMACSFVATCGPMWLQTTRTNPSHEPPSPEVFQASIPDVKGSQVIGLSLDLSEEAGALLIGESALEEILRNGLGPARGFSARVPMLRPK